LFPVPDNVSDEAAAQAFINPATAYALLDKLNAPKGEYIIQTAAASAFGRILIQFAKARGVRTINLVRRSEQIAELKAIGADAVLNTEDGTDIFEEIKRITGGKLAYGAIDAVGGEIGLKFSKSVRDDGLILLYGVLGGLEVTVSAVDLLFRNITYSGFWITRYVNEIGKAKFNELLNNVFNLLANEAETFNGSRYTLDKVADAIDQSLKPGRGGKVLLVHN
jgi:NADPH:quinone reductase-like Zn-dependent oxidoreductase